jgi:BlaI family penicillinase repressor
MAAQRTENVPSISEAEWRVIQVIWNQHPITANDVVRRLARKHDWSPRTIKTMLNRLVRKGALTYEAEGKRYIYSPAVSRDECIHAESQSFLHRVFEGATGPMLVHFVKNARLSDEDIEALRQILDEKGEG